MGNYHEIRKRLGGDDEGPWSFIHKGRIILGLCLRRDLNPEIESDKPEVWIGIEEPLPDWGERLASDTARIPVYVSPGERGDYVYKGNFEILPQTPTREYFESVRPIAPRGLSRIVFLKKI